MTIETEDNNVPQHRELSVQERRALYVSRTGKVTLGACWVGLLVAMILTSQVPITQQWSETNIATLATELWSATNIAFIVGLCVVLPLLHHMWTRKRLAMHQATASAAGLTNPAA